MSDIASYRVVDTSTQDKKLTKQDLNRIFWNIQSMSFSYNYEKLQTIGFAHCMIPVLERLYADADQATRIKAMKRHLEFYNSQVNTGALIMGVTAALEEKTTEEEKEAVVSVKAGLMGPLAGLGDSLLKFTWLPICGSIGAAFALQGNIIGPILMFLLFNIVNVGSKYFFIHYGYNKGVDLIEQSIKVQEMFDKVIPNLLTLLFALGIFFLVKKFKGKHTVALIVGMMVIGVICSTLGILN